MSERQTLSAGVAALLFASACAFAADDGKEEISLLDRPDPADAAGPANVLVVYNSDSPDGCRAAKYYALRRGVPEKNLLGLPLRGAEKGSSWRHFHSRILTPIREKLRSKCDDGTVLAERILYIVTTPGVSSTPLGGARPRGGAPATSG